MRAVIIVPRRAGDPVRDRAWEFVRDWWNSLGFEMYAVEHPGPEPFNRAWALNEGARRAWPWDVALFVDGDVFEANISQVAQAAVRAWRTGRFTIAHNVGKDLSEAASKKLLAGEKIVFDRSLVATRPNCTSRVNAVRSDLFEAVGGFDTRFRGWGHEDTAFEAAVEAYRPGAERIPGSCYHIWHPHMLSKSKDTPEWKAGKELQERYTAAKQKGGWGAVKDILDERAPAEKWEPGAAALNVSYYQERRENVPVEIVLLSCGRPEYLQGTIASLTKQVTGNVVSRTIIDDSGDRSFSDWAAHTFPGWKVLRHSSNLGYTESMAQTWEKLFREPGPDHIFWSEDDFEYTRHVELDDMVHILDNALPSLAQLVLLREPYYRPELVAGGIINQWPTEFTPRDVGGFKYLEHTKYFSSNPMMIRRDLMGVPWPRVKDSEAAFTPKLAKMGFKFGVYGWGETYLKHLGRTRRGRGGF